MNNCQYCNNIIEDNTHFNICIYYRYNNNFTFKLSNDEILSIVELSNLFDLYELNEIELIQINNIINKLVIKSNINNKLNNTIIVNIINLLYQYVNIDNSIDYDSILEILEIILDIKKNNIKNVIKTYKVCYDFLNNNN